MHSSDSNTPPTVAGSCAERILGILPSHAGKILVVFVASLAALNFGRAEEWSLSGFKIYFTQAIMQTTLLDFCVVLFVLSYFVHQDAKRHGVSWWWIVPTYPFMPGAGLLLYFFVRERKIRKIEAGSSRKR